MEEFISIPYSVSKFGHERDKGSIITRKLTKNIGSHNQFHKDFVITHLNEIHIFLFAKKYVNFIIFYFCQ